jgi:hypothetical protein
MTRWTLSLAVSVGLSLGCQSNRTPQSESRAGLSGGGNSTAIHVSGESAEAQFSSSTADGCGGSWMYIFAGDQVTHQSGTGSPTSWSEAWLWYEQYNWCTSEWVFGYAAADGVNFSADHNLNSGSLSGALPGYSYDYFTNTASNTTFNVNLTWTGSGNVYHGNSRTSWQYPGGRYDYRSNGASSDATVAGTVNGASVSGGGTLSEVNSGSVTIGSSYWGGGGGLAVD